MKKLFLILATAALSLGSFAGNPDDNNKGRKNDPDKYCAEFHDGMLKVMHNGEVLTQDVTLESGTKISVDGMITKVSGETQMLKEGECVNLDGNIESGNPENKGTGEPDKTKMNKSDKNMNPDKTPNTTKDRSGNYDKNKSMNPPKDKSAEPSKDKTYKSPKDNMPKDKESDVEPK